MEGGTTVMVAPVYEGSDAYAMSQAIVALGGRAGGVLASIESSGWRGRFDHGLAWKELTDHIVGPVYVAGKAVEADTAAGGLLTDQQQQTLARVVDQSISDISRQWDMFEVLNVRAISRATGHRLDEVDGWVTDVTADTRVGCQQGDLLELGAADVLGAPVNCDDGVVASLWDDAAAGLGDQLTEGSVDGGTCERMLGLTRLHHHRWPDDEPRRDFLVDAFQRFERLLADARVTDLLSCLGGGIRPTASLLGLELKLPGYAVDYATAVVRDGGEPWFVRLDQSGLATVLRAARLVHATVEAPVDQLDDADGPAQRLDLLLARATPGQGWSPETVRVAEEVAADVELDDTLAVTALMRALTHGGDEACGSDLVDVADRFAEHVAASGNPASFPLVSQAMAVRALRVCGRPVPEFEVAVLGRVEIVLARFDGQEKPALLEAADAVEAACALEPASLPPSEDRWRAYAFHGAAHGGSADEELGVISAGRTYSLAVLALTEAEDCDENGIPG